MNIRAYNRSRPGSPLSYSMNAPDVTQLLKDWSGGNKAALDALAPIVYNELRRLAASHLRRERPDHTLQATALVHEAYLKLIDQRNVQWQNRAHFFGIAAQMIRRLLVDHARTVKAAKRGGGVAALALDEALGVAEKRDLEIESLDDALHALAEVDPQQARIVELRFFTGLSIEETAEALGISASTVKRDWVVAKAWLFRQLSRTGAAAPAEDMGEE
jgi:RNA polymerase sigma factor (TIGR02999 family)